MALERARKVHRQQPDLLDGHRGVRDRAELGEDLGGGAIDIRVALADLLLERIADREPESQPDMEPADVLGQARPKLFVGCERGVDPGCGGGNDPVDIAHVDRLGSGGDIDELGQPE